MAYEGQYKRRMDDNGYGVPPEKRMSGGGQGYGQLQMGGGGRTAPYSYAPSQPPKMTRPNPNQVDDRPPCNILLFTIFNPKYPITVDVLHTICSPNGNVQRIVIFRKNGVQAMVEFDNIESAERAKEALNGADIYSGCCTLKIEWGKPTRLNVVKNDNDSWDYTDPNLGKEPPAGQKTLLPDPKYAPGPQSYGGPTGDYGGNDGGYDGYGQYGGHGGPGGPGGYGRPRFPGPGGPGGPGGHRQPFRGPDGYGPPQRRPYGPPQPGPMGGDYSGNEDQGGLMQQGAVLMVYGLNPDKMNCQRVFNLFCLFGNVVRVKFLKSKEGVAMVQLGDHLSCERAIANLNHTQFFGGKMMMGFSKQAFIQDVPNPMTLNDGSPSFMDFMGTRNNRFTTPEAAGKNRIHPASSVLYFFNVPAGIQQDTLTQVFVDAGVKPPSKIKIFPAKSEKSSTGLMEWDDRSDAIEGLVMTNHTQIPNPNGKFPYIMKLCFSGAPIKG